MGTESDALKKALKGIFRDVSQPDEDDLSDQMHYVPGVANLLPLPYMVFFALVIGAECKYSHRPAEKVAWSVRLRFKGEEMRVEHGKFGMRIASSAESPELAEEFIATVNRAFPVMDRILGPVVDERVRLGSVTVPNRQYLFRDRYEFFREAATKAFEMPNTGLEELIRDSGQSSGGVSVDPFKSEREGFFFGSAAIDAYFSWLEHVLVLALPFAGYDPDKDDLVQLIGHSWSAKLKKVWDLSVDKRAAKLYEKLILIKEKFRNSLAHGGFEKRGETLAVHIQGVGAVPARLSRFKDSIDHGLFPLKEVSFREVCDFLDDVDAHLREGPTAMAMMFIESGLDVAFDEESRDRYVRAMQSEAKLEELIYGLSRLTDIEVNMDW